MCGKRGFEKWYEAIAPLVVSWKRHVLCELFGSFWAVKSGKAFSGTFLG